MNVLMVGSSLDVRGGMTTVVEGFLDNKLNNINLFYIPTHIDKSKIKQIIFFGISILKITYYLIFKNILIVHMHMSERGSFIRKNIILKICKLFRKKVVVHMHGAEFKEYYDSKNKRYQDKIKKFFKSSDRIIVLGESWNNYIKSIDKNINTIVMPNFVGLRKEEVELKHNEINILFLAVLIKRKGVFDIIEAINYIVKNRKYNDYNINVIIAGTGEEEDAMKAKIINLGIEKHFTFKGWVNGDEKEKLLKSSQIFILPSYNEGLPVSILEAMSYGLPIISTNVGSIEDAVRNEYNGIIIKPGDIDSLINAIEVLITNKDKWNLFSKNSKKIVRDKFDKNAYFKNIEDLYFHI